MCRRTLVFLFPLILGCSTLLEYDGVDFDQPDGSAGSDSGGSAGDSGVAGAAGDAGGGGAATGGAGTGGSTGGTGGIGEEDSGGEPAPNPCDGVTCSGHGSCEVVDEQPSCVCDPGYHAKGLLCEADETCDGVNCGRCGKCEVIEGLATCTCPSGLKHDGNGCVVDPNPCDTIDCGADAVCVPESHCHPLGACVPTCDCSNCGNCGGDNSDGRWNDLQEYCGAEPDQSPATMVCNKPCPPGDGCLPYSQPFCWPMQGCFSL